MIMTINVHHNDDDDDDDDGNGDTSDLLPVVVEHFHSLYWRLPVQK